jgi:hypothetical protein
MAVVGRRHHQGGWTFRQTGAGNGFSGAVKLVSAVILIFVGIVQPRSRNLNKENPLLLEAQLFRKKIFR